MIENESTCTAHVAMGAHSPMFLSQLLLSTWWPFFKLVLRRRWLYHHGMKLTILMALLNKGSSRLVRMTEQHREVPCTRRTPLWAARILQESTSHFPTHRYRLRRSGAVVAETAMTIGTRVHRDRLSTGEIQHETSLWFLGQGN